MTFTAPASAFEHLALFYDGDDAYVKGVASFLQAGGDGVALVAVPRGHIDLLRGTPYSVPGQVSFVDMTDLGANPSCIIPAIRSFVDGHRGSPVRFVGEPTWPGRSDPESAEATRHEALINLAFGQSNAQILCPYDAGGLPGPVLADAERTHPHLVDGEQRVASTGYRDPLEFTDPANWPLDPAPQAAAPPVQFDGLVEPRRRVRAQAADAGLEPDRLAALLLAVNEICTNTLQHGPGPGTLRMWATDNGVVCEVHDAGAIADPLAGRHVKRAAADRGRGMFLAHHLCDLVEVRSSPAAGTTVRLHVHR